MSDRELKSENRELKPATLRRKAISYVKSLVPTRRGGGGDGFRWNGESLLIVQDQENNSDDHVAYSMTLIHDANHYRLASKDMRALPEFGLGAAPGTFWSMNYSMGDRLCVVDTIESSRAEAAASLLDVITFSRFGFPWRRIVDWHVQVTLGMEDARILHYRILPVLEGNEPDYLHCVFRALEEIMDS